MNIDEIRSHVRGVVREHGDLFQEVESLSDNENLFDAGLSSLGVVRVLITLEQDFSIMFPDELMTRATFSSIRSIAAAVEQTVAPVTVTEQ